MRYYNFALKTSADEIEKKSKIKLRDYDFDGVIGALNSYFYRNAENGVSFLAYREENDKLYAMISFDEKVTGYWPAYESVTKMLSENFGVKKVHAEPEEITLGQFFDCYLEGKRRGFITHYSRYSNLFTDWLYYYFTDGGDGIHDAHRFFFSEILVPKKPADMLDIYDESFAEELKNIERHEMVDVDGVNMAHYIIACNGLESANELTRSLVQNLVRANRVKSRRVSVIHNIQPEASNVVSRVEEIIQSNIGGAVVFDLSNTIGKSSNSYGLFVKHLEKIFKQYRNKCLFVFTYNMDNPGFAYSILPNLGKYANMVTLKEGRGDRRAAINYLKHLIANSEYAKYANQAREFFKDFEGNDFSQSEVIAAYEKFEPWCINKNLAGAYVFRTEDDFMLERDASDESASDKLNSLIGLASVKKRIKEIIASNVADRERKKRMGKDYQTSCMHMVFSGNPGTAKTTVAKLFAKIAKDNGLLKSGIFVEYTGKDTEDKEVSMSIAEAFRAAEGGVLFFDEAYALWGITTLVQELEKHKDDVVAIFAGYTDAMKEFLDRNEGLKSRIPYTVEFPDYTTDELMDIFDYMLKERRLTIADDVNVEVQNFFDKQRLMKNFGNGRYVRNFVEGALQKQSARLCEKYSNIAEAGKKELFHLVREDVLMAEDKHYEVRREGDAAKELDEMIGLASVKSVIRKAVASSKFNKLCIEKGMAKKPASMHMVFTGNPGSAKTTVARLFAEILKDEKVLASGHIVEVGRADLVAPFVGQTAIQVKHKFKEAQGGVLFIDEAYALSDFHKGSFGDEAINTIVQEMENHRDDMVVVFAGYPEPMKEFLERNPGMKSRIAFEINFEDYNVDELCGITKLMLKKQNLKITDAAMDKLRNAYGAVHTENDYGNGRFVRNMLEKASMSLAERVTALNPSEVTEDILLTIEECDIPDAPKKSNSEKGKIGFIIGAA